MARSASQRAENNLMGLWSLLSITAAGLFPSPTKFPDFYRKPIESGSSLELLAQLRQRIRPSMLRRAKEQVAVDLPDKQEQILEVDLAPKHRALYDRRLQRERQMILGLVDDLDRNRITILRSPTVLRQTSLDAAPVDDTHAKVGSAEVDALFEQLDDVVAGGHRALVFSQFTGFLTRVRDRLVAVGIECSTSTVRPDSAARSSTHSRTGRSRYSTSASRPVGSV